MSEQGKRVQHRKQEDAAFNKMLLWMAGAVGVEILSLLVRRLYINFNLTNVGVAVASGFSAFFRVFQYVGIVLVIAGCIWTVLTYKKKGKMILPLACTGGALWLWIAAFLCYNYQSAGARILCFIPAVIAIFAAVFFLYQREFFWNVVLGGIGITALWVFRQIYMEHPRMTYCGFAVVWVVMALAAFIAFKVGKKNGKLGSLRVMPVEAGYLPVYLTCAAVAVALVAALILGVSAAYYVLAALAGWLFFLAVYYTVKLM